MSSGALVHCPGVAAGAVEHCLLTGLRLLPSLSVLLGMWYSAGSAEFSSYKVGINMHMTFLNSFFPLIFSTEAFSKISDIHIY